jgi:membrane-associated phospholipid phosphatase
MPLVLASLVAWSRVALGLHFPIDVLAGVLVGCASGALALLGSGQGVAWRRALPPA